MSVVIICRGRASGEPCSELNMYLRDCDVEAYEGIGLATWTRDKRKAKRFADVEAAHAFWMRQSETHPTRYDGKPNRPLTAYTIEMIR